jgi:nucleotide-binding universal stress UspA family protein
MQTLNFRSILVATDLEPGTDVALSNAAALASTLGAELHVVHTVSLPTAEYPTAPASIDTQREVHAARRLLREQLERALGSDAKVASQQVRSDSAHRGINARAGEVEADLIVLGPHRPRMFRGPILGNTADRVLRSASVPVLILSEPLELPLERVVVPIDLSDPARGALDQALIWANSLGVRAATGGAANVEVNVLHVIPRMFEAYDFPFDRAVIVPQLRSEIDEAFTRVGEGTDAEVRDEVVWGNAPADEICRYVEDHDASLLVMGTHGYGALGRALIGSITSRVARAAPCPLLLVPPPLWEGEQPQASIPIEVEFSEPATSAQ